MAGIRLPKRSVRHAIGVVLATLFLQGWQIKAQVTPQFNTPVQVSIEAVYLTWNPFPAAQSYQIYWGTSPGVNLSSPMIPIPNASINSYWHVGLTGGATYYYRIRALDQFNNWTLLSPEVSVTVPPQPTQWYSGGNGDGHARELLCTSTLNGMPSPPTFSNVFVYPSCEQNFIAWIQLPGAAQYSVQSATNSSGPYSTLTTTTGLSFVHTGITPGQTLYYRVQPTGTFTCPVNPSVPVAVTNIGNFNSILGGNADGHAREIMCTRTLNGVPAPPQTPAPIVYVGIQELYLHWGQVAGAASYDLQFSVTSPTGPWTPLASATTALSFTHSNLVAGTTYYYRLRANMANGCPMDWSLTVQGVPAPLIEATGVGVGGGVGDGHAALRTCPMFLNGTTDAPPSPPISVYMSSEHNYIAWPQQPGALNYTMEVATSSGGPWNTLATTINLFFVHQPPSLVPGTQYFYRVTANLTGGCPLAPSPAVPSFSAPYYSMNCGGGVADGHARELTCVIYLNGASAAPQSQPITVYNSMEQNLIAWPQQTGAVNYTVEVGNSASGPWSTLATTTLTAFVHQPPSLVPGTPYFYRVTANLSTGCPLNPSAPVGNIAVPQYAFYGGGVADGHAWWATCPMYLNGNSAAALSPTPSVYPSQESVYIAWPQVPGASGYVLEFSTDGGITWTSLVTTAALAFLHSTVTGGTYYQYRITAQLLAGCPLQPSAPSAALAPAPSYLIYYGGVADGHANARSCTFITLDQYTVNASGPTTFCDGQSVMLVASPNAQLYTWYNGSTPIPNSNNDTLVVNQSGTYTVDLFNIYSCWAASLPIVLTVNPAPPNPPPPVAQPSGYSCGPVELTAVGNPAPHQYYWQLTPNGTSTAYPGTQPFVATASGIYYLSTLAANGCWSSVPSSATVVIAPVPTQITPSTNSSVCEIGGLNQWNYLVAPDGRAIAAIQNNGYAMGSTLATCYVSTALSNPFDGLHEFLGRRFVIQPDVQPGGYVTVRLYFTPQEFNNLVQATLNTPGSGDDVTSLADLMVTKYTGPTEDDTYDLSDAVDWQILIPTAYGNDLNGHYVEVSVNSFSEFWIHGPFMPLPVTLTAFTAECRPASILVRWKTETEINNMHFEIQHSPDLLNWQHLATVPGAGHSNMFLSYSYLWENPEPGVRYLRLKQVDFNGDFTYSYPISVNCPAAMPEHFRLLSAAGQSDGRVRVQVESPDAVEVVWEVYDLNGRKIWHHRTHVPAGLTHFLLPAELWASAAYLLKATSSYGQHTLRFVR